ncbi:asparagine synthase-related protein [Erwinia psidii]|uniref:asparagine synthase-related protein n=2 Tax=Erwinia psidii TaxID=69224 RepID=UPI002B45EA33|nr:asparagine synthase-related protein [Erwinia psidii]
MEYGGNHWMQEAQRVRVDIGSMANWLEIRVTYPDKQVVGFGSCLPARRKLNAGKEKYLLECLALRYLPDHIVNRKKQELAVPLEPWMVSSMKTRITETLTSVRRCHPGFFILTDCTKWSATLTVATAMRCGPSVCWRNGISSLLIIRSDE